MHKAGEDVMSGRAELLEERRLAVLHPCVVTLGAFDGRGLMPVGTSGWNRLDGVFGGEKILDRRRAVGPGEDDAAAAHIDRRFEAIEHRRPVGIGDISRSQRIAERVLGDLPAGTAVGAAGLTQQDTESGQALFLW